MTTHSGALALLTGEQIVEAGLAAARSDATIVMAYSSSATNVRWANNTVTTSGLADSVEFVVVAIAAGRAATVAGSASDAVSAAAVAEVVAAAELAASGVVGDRARDAMPLWEPPAGMAVDSDFTDAAPHTSFDVFAGLLPDLADQFAAARSDNRILYGFARHELTTVYLGTSTGVRRRWVQPTGAIELNAKSADLQRSSWVGQSTADFSDVALPALVAETSQRLQWAQRTIDLAPGRYPTVMPATSVADMMIYLAWSASGRAAFEGHSAFSRAGGTRVGEKLTDLPLHLFADPAAAGLEYAPFIATGHSSDEVSVFDNGAPAGRIDVVQEGVIRDLIHTRASAQEYNATPTSSPDNLLLTGGTAGRTIDDIVAGVDRGLLLTSLWYIREVDPMTLLLTGLTRDGVFLVENGEVTAAVNNFRFNMSPLDVLRNAADVGETERCLSREWSDYFTRTAMPPMLVGDFHMSSVSQAQ